MKKLNHLEQLDEHLRIMPKPNLNKERELQIKRTILNTRAANIKPKKKRNYKGIAATIGALAAAFIFSLLLYGALGKEQQSTLLLTNFIEDEVSKISGELNGNTYTSDDQAIINLFYEKMEDTELVETVASDTQFAETLEVYNNQNQLIGAFHFSDSNVVMIDGKQYEMNTAEWQNFKEVFYTDEYLVVEDSEDEPEEQPEESINVEELIDQELAKAPSERDWDTILGHIQEGANPDRALQLAAKDNLDTVVESLLLAGADPNSLDKNKDTPLTLTTSTEVASLLIENGANIEHRNARDYNALVLAVYGHQTEMAKLLLEANANPNTTVTSNNDVTVLWMASKFNDQSIKDLLIQHGAELVEGYEYEGWMASEIPTLEEMLTADLLSYASIGRLPNLMTIQLPADSSIFPNQYGEAFESFTVENGVADVYGDHLFIKSGGGNLYTKYQYELNPGDNVTVNDIEAALGQPSSTYMDEANGLRYLSYSLDHYELRFSFDGTVTYPKEETAILSLELLYKQPGIVEHAETVFDLLATRNMTELANHVHPEKGVVFAPFLQLNSTPLTEEHEPVIFQANEISGLLQNKTVYHWGDHGSSGLPIDMSPAEYLDNYVYTKQEPDSIFINQQDLSGPEFFTDIIRGEYPDAHMVQYSFNETIPGDDLSWLQLTLIFEPYNNEWKLVGILHNAWTP
ncbi:ankyrin repeat domain-containing protein [Ornithinibacillus massiliensis]|uniref:Ankyrin repeat domain-containing protein n=1 Tax=Ornithinibacillus massiliensis TaxID=1944633 RepID=A0ABS5MGE9_9BACI|nr:ankyrin repeat domain-containing protein [Ornithinibacillus massiliensis]MBS3681417.1 ankyrin repeat domain-containing protein [Ornithinibacillus massiliensis]